MVPPLSMCEKNKRELGNFREHITWISGNFLSNRLKKSMRIQLAFFLEPTDCCIFPANFPAKQSNLLVSSMGNLKISEVCRGAKSTMPWASGSFLEDVQSDLKVDMGGHHGDTDSFTVFTTYSHRRVQFIKFDPKKTIKICPGSAAWQLAI